MEQNPSQNAPSAAPMMTSQLDSFVNLALGLAMLAVFALVISANVADPDLWGHVRFGQDIIRLGHIPVDDPYSYTNKGFAWVNHEWIAEILMAWSYNALGVQGLVLLKGVVFLCIIALMALTLRGAGLGLLSGGIFILIALQLMGSGTVVIRPHLATYLFFTVLCFVLRQATLATSKWLWLLPLLFVLWINCHGGFLAGMAILVVWSSIQTIVFIREGKRREIAGIWAPVVFTLLALLVNPYGTGLLAFLLKTATLPRPEIGEWNALPIASEGGLYYLATCVIVLLSLFYTRLKRQPALIVTMAIMMVAPLVALRHLALFTFAVSFFVPEHINDLWRRCSQAVGGYELKQFSWHSKLTIAVASLLAAGFTIFKVAQSSGKILPMRGAPTAAVNLLSEVKAKGNMVVFFDWGEYVIWHLSPDVKVSLDGRRETAYPIKTYLDSIAFMDGVAAWDNILDKYPSDLVLTTKELACYSLMKLKPGWTLVFEDGNSAIFARNGSDIIAAIQKRLNSGVPISRADNGFP